MGGGLWKASHQVCAAGLGWACIPRLLQKGQEMEKSILVNFQKTPELTLSGLKCLNLRVNLRTSFNPAGLVCSETQPCRTTPGCPVPVLKGRNRASSRLSDPNLQASLPLPHCPVWFSGLPSLGERVCLPHGTSGGTNFCTDYHPGFGLTVVSQRGPPATEFKAAPLPTLSISQYLVFVIVHIALVASDIAVVC